jgi:hypothetical protein
MPLRDDRAVIACPRPRLATDPRPANRPRGRVGTAPAAPRRSKSMLRRSSGRSIVRRPGPSPVCGDDRRTVGRTGPAAAAWRRAPRAAARPYGRKPGSDPPAGERAAVAIRTIPGRVRPRTVERGGERAGVRGQAADVDVALGERQVDAMLPEQPPHPVGHVRLDIADPGLGIVHPDRYVVIDRTLAERTQPDRRRRFGENAGRGGRRLDHQLLGERKVAVISYADPDAQANVPARSSTSR